MGLGHQLNALPAKESLGLGFKQATSVAHHVLVPFLPVVQAHQGQAVFHVLEPISVR